MNHIIKNITAEQARTCLLSSMKSVIRYWSGDQTISESAVLGLAVGFKFRFGYYTNARSREKINFGLPDIACFHIALDNAGFTDLFKAYDLAFVEVKNPSLADMLDNIKTEIAADRPVIITITNKHLEYVPPELQIDIGRYAVGYGWDDDAGKVWVSDQFISTVPPSYYQGSVSFSSFLKAVNLDEVKLDTDYTTWNFKPLATSQSTDNYKQLRNRIITGIGEAYNNMHTSLCEVFTYADSRAEFISGFEGITCFRDDLQRIAAAGITEDTKKWLFEVYSLLRTFAGPVISRSLYSDYLVWAGSRYRIIIEDTVIEECRDIGNEWNVIANVIYKSARDADTESLQRVISRVDKIAAREKDWIDSLQRVYKNNLTRSE